MADYIIVADNVKPVAVDGVNPTISRTIAGEAITAGQTVVINVTDSLLYGGTGDTNGIALNNGVIGQPVDYIQDGYVEVGAAVGAVGDIAIQSGTAGGLAPSVDLGAGETLTILGYFTEVGQLRVKICNTGAVKA